ncbi:MAG: vWA domain-containing protein, partial [Planctomycetota bacterium]
MNNTYNYSSSAAASIQLPYSPHESWPNGFSAQSDDRKMNVPHPNSESGPVVSTNPGEAASGLDAPQLDDTWEEWMDEEEGFFGGDMVAMIGSLLVHMMVILGLALIPLMGNQAEEQAALIVVPPEEVPVEIEDTFEIEEVTYSDVPSTDVGANAEDDASMALATAEVFSETVDIPSPVELDFSPMAELMENNMFTEATAPLVRDTSQKGSVGTATTGAKGAVDRITFEILRSMEERPTLVCWLFDQSGSLTRQRAEIRQRFDRIYEELGIIEASGQSPAFNGQDSGDDKQKNTEAPLLTSIVGFGDRVALFTEEPTAELSEIKSVVDGIPVDSTGNENVFAAISATVDRYKRLRRRGSDGNPIRNVMVIVVTDERGDDAMRMERAITDCKRSGIPVYVIGVPAPFGRAETLVKYVDPNPKFDQSPSWARVDQGPESYMPERVKLGFSGNFSQEPALDSGFGPYALTRMCYETGGIYFTVHPNRNVNRTVRRGEIDPFAAHISHFFDPNVMSRYRPDYVPPQTYVSLVKRSTLRSSLVRAASMPGTDTLKATDLRFVNRSEAGLV